MSMEGDNCNTSVIKKTRSIYTKEKLSGHDSSYYDVPTFSPLEVEKHFREQDGRNDDGANLGGLEHAAIIT